jgi:RimJ/RimL family protein N-acetyltransferase
MIPPTLTTARLTLSPPEASDFEDSAAMWSDPLVTRHIGGRTSTPEEAGSACCAPGACGRCWAMATGRRARRRPAAMSARSASPTSTAASRPSIDGVPEMGWALAGWAHGRGFASEAIAAGPGLGPHPVGRRAGGLHHRPRQRPSLKLALKMGFLEVARTTYREAPTVLLQRG